MYYRPRSRGDNTFGSVRLSVCVCVCPSSPVLKHHRVFISRSIQNGWALKMVVVSTGCAIAVDHAFNCVHDAFSRGLIEYARSYSVEHLVRVFSSR